MAFFQGTFDSDYVTSQLKQFRSAKKPGSIGTIYVDNKFLFQKNRVHRTTGTVYYECCNRKHGCKARGQVTSTGCYQFGGIKEHTCAHSLGDAMAKMFRTLVEWRAEQYPLQKPKEIYTNARLEAVPALMSLYDETYGAREEFEQFINSKLKTCDELRRAITATQKKSYPVQGGLVTADDLDVSHYAEMVLNARVEVEHATPDGNVVNKRIIVFGTRAAFRALVSSNRLLCDGTFRSVPKIFDSLYTIHGVHCEAVVPMVYALLPDRTTETYTALFKAINSLAVDRFNRGLAPDAVLIDFEMAAHNAIRAVFNPPNNGEEDRHIVNIKGCKFHHGQAIYKRVQKIGAVPVFNTSRPFELLVRRSMALAYTDPDYIYALWHWAKQQFQWPKDPSDPLNQSELVVKARSFVAYVEQTWIGQYLLRPDEPSLLLHVTVPPRFPKEMWNHFGNVEENRTTNHCESWHSRWNTLVAIAHPPADTFLIKLHEETQTTQIRMHEAAGGGRLRGKCDQTKKRNAGLKRAHSQYMMAAHTAVSARAPGDYPYREIFGYAKDHFLQVQDQIGVPKDFGIRYDAEAEA